MRPWKLQATPLASVYEPAAFLSGFMETTGALALAPRLLAGAHRRPNTKHETPNIQIIASPNSSAKQLPYSRIATTDWPQFAHADSF
jgi:hypothetical protein